MISHDHSFQSIKQNQSGLQVIQAVTFLIPQLEVKLSKLVPKTIPKRSPAELPVPDGCTLVFQRGLCLDPDFCDFPGARNAGNHPIASSECGTFRGPCEVGCGMLWSCPLEFCWSWPFRSDTYWNKLSDWNAYSEWLSEHDLQRQKRKKRFPRCTSKMAKEHFQDVGFFLGHIATILPIEMRKRCLVFSMRMYANLFKIDPNLPKNDRNRVVPSGWLIFACRSDKYCRGIMKRLALPTMVQPTSICCWLEHPSWFVGVTKCIPKNLQAISKQQQRKACK